MDIVQKAHDSLVEAEAKGASFLVGGPRYTGPAELAPTIVENVSENMTIFDTETFGPSVSLYVVKDDEAAIKTANNSVYGLNASIHTTNMQRAINVGRRLEFGQVHVNNLTTHNEGEVTLPSVFRYSPACHTYTLLTTSRILTCCQQLSQLVEREAADGGEIILSSVLRNLCN